MAYNKVDADGRTLIDLTSDTVTADTLVSGRTAHLASGERVTGTFEPVTGVKGNAESTYRKGDVNLTPANIGAATTAQGTKADNAVQTVQVNGTAQTKTNNTVNISLDKSSVGLENVDNTSDLNKPISTATQTALNAQQAQIDNNSEVSEVTDTTPYLYKSSEHDAVYDELVGGSVAWNQIIQNGNFASTSRWSGRYSTISVSNNVCTVTPSSAGTLRGLIGSETAETVSQNHKLLLSVYILSPITTNVGLSLNGNNQKTISVTANVWKKCECVWTDNVDTAKRLYALIIDNLTTSQIIQYKNAFVIDLTQMFGPTIADYAYNLEQSTAGSGVEWLKSYGFFAKDYYSYNAGSLISANTSGKKVVSETTEITYPIQSTDLRGLYKLNGNKLYTDGDIYSADGTITRKYGIVDLGTLNWQLTSGVFTPTTNIGAKVQSIQGTLANILCPKYVTIQQNQISGKDKVIFGLNWGTGVGIIDSTYSDANAFKTAMSGIYLIYELATPTTVTASPFTSPQMVYRNGTEEYLDTRDVPMPVGGNRKYVDIPDWMVNEYFDDLRAETSTLLVKIENINNGINEIESDMRGVTQDLNDLSGELDCLTIRAALVNNEVIIQNTSDFTNELYSKYFSYTKPKFAILKLQITSNTYYYKALINSSSVSHGNLMEASFITVNGTYMGIYNFRWNFSSTVGTPTVSYTSLNLGS